MKLVKYFDRFLAETVNLNQSRLDNLDSRVGNITTALKESPYLNGRVLDIVPQGSWAHRTIIRPAHGLEFDADFLIELREDDEWNESPKRYATAVWNALYKHPTYGDMSKKKDRCVRVTYANDCHIDVVTYVVLSSGREVIVNRATNEFEDTNPVGFTEWIQEKDDLTGGNLRKVLRLLKYLRDHQNAFTVKSVLLTTMVGRVVDEWRSIDPSYYKDVPTTLLHLVEDLDNWLQAHWSKPSLSDPSCPSTTFDHRWTEAQYLSFRDKTHSLLPKIQKAYDAETVAESIEEWRMVFGDAFPDSSVSKSSVVGRDISPNEATQRDVRAPREQFIEELFAVNDRFTVIIECEVSDPERPNRQQRRQLKALHGRVPKYRRLLFKVTRTDVPQPFSVYWKVRNRGEEAARLNALRGEIVPDEGEHQRAERTAYIGNHFVECYIVKDNVCVAQTHQPVIIAS